MSKIICEICGTTYQDSAANCPICGWARSNAQNAEFDPKEFNIDFLNEETTQAAEVDTEKETNTVAAAPIPAGGKKNGVIFDYDAVNAEPAAHESEDEAEEENEEEEDEPRSNTFLVILLVVLIVALLLVSGFIFWKYYLPNQHAQEAAPTTQATEQSEPVTEESEEVSVPCTGLYLVSGMEKLTYEGKNWLLHVKVVPEDTTDQLVFVSENESIVTVNEEGRVTAVGEGETRIVVTCGDQIVSCAAVVDYSAEETEATVEETAAVSETESSEQPAETTESEATEATEAKATEAPAANNDVVLKLKRTDITIGRRGVYVELQLDCELTMDQVVWATRNAGVATVNSKGEVTAVAPGLTVVTCTYGNQTVECIVRCNF